MIFYIRLLHSGPQVEQRNGTGKPIRAGLHRFFGFVGLENMGRRMRFKANTPTKPGVSKGGLCLPFGTRPCLQGVVCYTCRRG